MENFTRGPYQDSPTPSPSPSPQTTPSSRASTARPSTSGFHGPASQPLEPYRDDPDEEPFPLNVEDPFASVTAAPTQRHRSAAAIPHAQLQIFIPPYTDAAISYDDDDVPLAHLYPYPTEAPPSYHFAVREAFRETLRRHLPSNSVSTTTSDEEAFVSGNLEQADDVRFSVERLVAAIIVAMMMLVIASLLALFALTLSGVRT